jgi:hypothetical protein
MCAANGYSGAPKTAVELMSAVASYVLELASSKVPALKDGTSEVKYVLTFPADFDFGRRNSLMEAFSVAGVSINDIDSMHDEATSACVGYMHLHDLFDGKTDIEYPATACHHLTSDTHLTSVSLGSPLSPILVTVILPDPTSSDHKFMLIVDMGGGTLDASMLRLERYEDMWSIKVVDTKGCVGNAGKDIKAVLRSLLGGSTPESILESLIVKVGPAPIACTDLPQCIDDRSALHSYLPSRLSSTAGSP